MSRTMFDARGVVVDGVTTPFFSGALAYWQTPRADWAGALRAIHKTGFTVVTTTVPWRLHAADAKPTFAGDLDLTAFVAAARATGLHVALRIGPTAGIELPCFGLPDRVVANTSVQAVTSRGTPAWIPAPPRAFPIPSYASSTFHGLVGEWYGQLAAALASSEIASLGIDHHAQLFYRLGAFDLDYHPDALALWRSSSGFEEPPRAWDPADRARCLAWVKFKDAYLAHGLGAFANAIDATPLTGIARTHALPPGEHGLVDRRGLADAIGGLVGVSSHAERSGLRGLREQGAAIASASLPLVLETRPAVSPWLPPLDLAGVDPTRARDELLTLLATGVRGFVVEDPIQAWVSPLLAALADVQWTSLRRDTPVALIDVRADARFSVATNVIDPVTPTVADLLQLGPGGAAELGTDTDAPVMKRWFSAIVSALEIAHVPFTIVDETAPPETLETFKAIIAPTLQRIDRGLWARLRAIAEAKKAIVVIGPTTPTHDELGEPLPSDPPKRMGKIRDGSLYDVPGLAQDLAGLVTLPDSWQIERPDDVRAFAFADGAKVRAVVVASDAPKTVSAVLLAEGGSLRDPISRESFAISDGKATISLPPRGVRLLIVE